VLATVPLLAPGLLVWEKYRSPAIVNGGAIAAGCAAMFLLVAARMLLLVRQVEAQAVALRAHAVQLTEIADRDHLTGLLNRRAWNTAMPVALDRARRVGDRVTLVMLDLDHFKRFNDEHGHPAGDELLREASAVWAASIREADLLARYGGEEFIMLLPATDAQSAVDVLERLRPLTPRGCTFSAGVAEWDGSETAEDLLARADKSLYRAKAAGRDRIERDTQPQYASQPTA
jgi:diguanylate cyclase (GGDEF)-like protein